MSFLRKGVRRRGKVATAATTVVALAAFQALAIIGATAAFAENCDVTTPGTLTVDLFSNDSVTIEVASDGTIETSGSNCDDADELGHQHDRRHRRGRQRGTLHR